MVTKQRKIVNPKNGRDNVTEATNSHSKWRWGPEKVYHWTVTFGAFSYVMWRFANNEENAFLMNQMKYAFSKSPYGLKQKQDTSNWGWQTTKYIMVNTWKWYLLHPLLGRAMAHVAPSLVPVFYAAYSSLFVALNFGWEVVLLFLGQHAVFYIVAALRVPALCYLAAAVIHCQKFVNPFDTAFGGVRRFPLEHYAWSQLQPGLRSSSASRSTEELVSLGAILEDALLHGLPAHDLPWTSAELR